MVEIEETELNRLREIETAHNALTEEHKKLRENHETLRVEHEELSSSYIALCKGQQGAEQPTEENEFDALCNKIFKRGK